MSDFIPGQRWVSVSELNLGLGTVLSSDQRSVTIVFLASSETRSYSKQTSALSRVRFAPGDSVRSHEGWTLNIESTEEHAGLLTYLGTKNENEKAKLEEGQLDNFIQLNRPTDRLFTGQIDHDKWFELRYQTLHHLNRLAHSDVRGLIGGRTMLIPHQVYIAHEIANRYAPRVLLADEVGLGKTIEAGLILHHQLHTERAHRILIIVPESLLHQWLVEMLRRFNLHFSVFDEERCLADEESATQDNPFLTEQLVICSLSFFISHPDRLQQALAGLWDLLVVDEAHHLQWTPQHTSPEYNVIENFSVATKGVLLLTATPEQLGKASHFARLRLLDPDRFPNLDDFIKEEETYEPIAQAIEELLNRQPLSQRGYHTLLSTIKEMDNKELLNIVQNTRASEEEKNLARQELVEHLLDRHGTGRVLFRNTRTTIKGFPSREVTAYALPLPELYAACLAQFQTAGLTESQLFLSPELLYESMDTRGQPNWTDIDPRLNWLIKKLEELRPKKVLVLTASAQTALDLSTALRIKTGIHAAVFHEGLSIIERDRAAAFFADIDYGSQVLICSEIGSEGRNFQFSHHLILFDLPLNPDLLEQRIGRLDRIGQTETIQIHVPYLEQSAQAVMYHWYHHGLSAFEHTCPAGHNIFIQVEPLLIDALHQADENAENITALISTTKTLHNTLNETLRLGQDRLLEYNSYRPHIGEALCQHAAAQDADNHLPEYLNTVFDCFGIDMEEHTNASYILRPGEHMQTSSFPGLREDGMTITYKRNIALINEDMQFITWEHPLVTGAIDMVLSSELGNTAVAIAKYNEVESGTILLESIYILETASNEILQSNRYLPPTTIRVIVDQHGNDHSADFPHKFTHSPQPNVKKETANKIIRMHTQLLRKLINLSENYAQQQAPTILSAAHEQTKTTLMTEINRLNALHQVNPNIRDEEIQFFETQLQTLTKVLESASLRLDALRVIIAT